jgi:hypothetical protein
MDENKFTIKFYDTKSREIFKPIILTDYIRGQNKITLPQSRKLRNINLNKIKVFFQEKVIETIPIINGRDIKMWPGDTLSITL